MYLLIKPVSLIIKLARWKMRGNFWEQVPRTYSMCGNSWSFILVIHLLFFQCVYDVTTAATTAMVKPPELSDILLPHNMIDHIYTQIMLSQPSLAFEPLHKILG